MAIKQYVKDDLTVIWQSERCIHSGHCVRGLPNVFDTSKRPWINLEPAEKQQIIDQVNRCPSGALSYKLEGLERLADSGSPSIDVVVIPNGPLQFNFGCRITLKNGEQMIKNEKSFFCRCGGSSNKPFCDGSHKKNGFRDEQIDQR